MSKPVISIRSLVLIVLSVVIASTGSGFFQNKQAQALSGSDFKAGRIMDDGVFFDPRGLSAQEIQSFLNAKVPTCDTNGTQPYAGTTRAAYGTSKGYPPPYICLKNYRQDTVSKPAEDGLCKGYSVANQSAADIIYGVAQSCGINPRVLIVLLQKEQGLVTDDWPWSSQYRKATGFGCPDTATCDTQYAGFFNQVYSAARQFKVYSMYPNSYNYVQNRNNTILYSPTTSCGSSTVFIQNQATAGLYIYTPYQPNQQALDNLYGTGNSCSSYGNRNFWRYFNDWFGSPYSPNYAWQKVSMTVMDEGKNAEIPTDFMHPGERLFVTVTAKNTGLATWYRDGNNPGRLGTQRPHDHLTPYCDTTWILCNRAAKLVEASVPPNGIGHFEFYMAVPNDPGEYREYLEPVMEYQSWMSNDEGFNIYVRDTKSYDWQWKYYNAWTDSTKTTPVDLNNVAKNQQIYIELHIKNRSATVWKNTGPNPVRLGAYNPQDHNSPFCTQTWISCNRAGTMDQATVAPGQEAIFSFTVKAPGTNGTYREYFKPVLEYKGWTRDDPNHIYLNVTR